MLKLAIFAAVLAAAGAGAYYLLMSGDFVAFQSWILKQGAWAPFIFTLIYIGVTMVAVPGAPLTMVAGALFGSITGVLVIFIGSTVTCSASFLISRYFARDAFEAWLLRKERFRRLDRLTETRGSIIVAVARLVPILPFSVVNYGFGLTRVRFWTYLMFSVCCMVPGIILHAVGSDAVIQLMKNGRMPWQLLWIIGGVFAVVLMLIPVARKVMKSAPVPTED